MKRPDHSSAFGLACLLGAGCIDDVELATASDGSSSSTRGSTDTTEDAPGSSEGSSTGSSDGGDPSETTDPLGCPYGDVFITTQAELELMTGCESVSGTLALVQDVTSLAPLASLREVGGDLRIGDPEGAATPGLDTLAGLEALETIGGGLYIDSVQSLGSIAALGNLRFVHELRVYALPALASLEGLQGIEELDGTLVLGDMPLLVDLAGLRNLGRVGRNLALAELPLADFGGLDALTAVGEPGGNASVITIDANPNLVSLAGLDGIAWHDRTQLQISRNPMLVELSAFASATELEMLALGGSEALVSLTGLESLERIHGDLVLQGNPALADLTPLGALESVGGLAIYGPHALTDLSGLDGLAEIERLALADTGLIELGPLPALASVGGVDLRANAALVELTGLASISTLEELWIEGNPSLVQLDDLAALHEVTGSMYLRDNDGLVELEGLGVTVVGGGLGIVLHGALAQADAVAWAADVDVAGPVKVAGNLGDEVPADPCAWAGDGVCDEPDLCAVDTDEGDCPAGPD